MKRVFSGLQPSGNLTIGNYFGAMKNFKSMSNEHSCLFCVADLHAITVRQDPKELQQNILQVYATYLALGLNPQNSTIFIQSHVRAHTEFMWILNTFTQFGELSRMHQFKDKSAKNADNINAGLFTYPVLQAADILLYDTNLVPVGVDQKQHIELTRNIAIRFNNIYRDVLVVPEDYIAPEGGKIMSLQDPTRKMSKSDEVAGAYITLSEDDTSILKKFKRAVTDSVGEINYTDDQPGVKNLIDIFACATGKTTDDALAEFAGKGYGDLKVAVAEAVIAEISPLKQEYERLMKDPGYLLKIAAESAQKAETVAEKTLTRAKKAVGFI